MIEFQVINSFIIKAEVLFHKLLITFNKLTTLGAEASKTI